MSRAKRNRNMKDVGRGAKEVVMGSVAEVAETQAEEAAEQSKENDAKRIVRIVNGVGNEPIEVVLDGSKEYSVREVLAKVRLFMEDDGNAATLGRKRIKDLDGTTVQPGDTLVITRRLSNG